MNGPICEKRSSGRAHRTYGVGEWEGSMHEFRNSQQIQQASIVSRDTTTEFLRAFLWFFVLCFSSLIEIRSRVEVVLGFGCLQLPCV